MKADSHRRWSTQSRLLQEPAKNAARMRISRPRSPGLGWSPAPQTLARIVGASVLVLVVIAVCLVLVLSALKSKESRMRGFRRLGFEAVGVAGDTLIMARPRQRPWRGGAGRPT